MTGGHTRIRIELSACEIISLIETGTWNPSPGQLAALARALHIAPPELLLHEVVLPEAEVVR